MSSSFDSLPPVYRIAVLLGARVEVQLKKEQEWHPYHQCFFSYDTPLRVKEGDEALLDDARRMIPQFYDMVEFREYDYLVPKVAIKPGNIIQFIYGFGAYGRVQEDGSIIEVSEEEHKMIYESKKDNYYHLAVSVGTYMGTKDRGES